MHVLGLETVSMVYKYMFGALINLFSCLVYFVYMQIYANAC